MIRIAIIALLLSGCQSLSTSDAIGGASISITTTARVITEECGNTVPDGPCTSDSLIPTERKTQMKATLRSAQVLVAAADEAYEDGREANHFLERAQIVIASVRQLLTDLGVTGD